MSIAQLVEHLAEGPSVGPGGAAYLGRHMANQLGKWQGHRPRPDRHGGHHGTMRRSSGSHMGRMYGLIGRLAGLTLSPHQTDHEAPSQ